MTNELKSNNVTELLIKLTEGSKSVLETLLPLIYNELRQLAGDF